MLKEEYLGWRTKDVAGTGTGPVSYNHSSPTLYAESPALVLPVIIRAKSSSHLSSIKRCCEGVITMVWGFRRSKTPVRKADTDPVMPPTTLHNLPPTVQDDDDTVYVTKSAHTGSVFGVESLLARPAHCKPSLLTGHSEFLCQLRKTRLWWQKVYLYRYWLGKTLHTETESTECLPMKWVLSIHLNLL